MKCTFGGCDEKAPSRRPVWRESDTANARAAGWFIWDERAPVWFNGQEIEGMALCPSHFATERGKRLVAIHDEAIARLSATTETPKGTP